MAVKPIVVIVERDMEELIPLFLSQRKADQAAIARALETHNFEALRRTGHGMAGAGTSYGFDALSKLGDRLVKAARARNVALLAKLKTEFDDYMARLVVKYV